MTFVHYTSTVKAGRILELPEETDALHLEPGQAVDIQVAPLVTAQDDIALLESWIAQAPTDPEEIREAEAEFREFKRNLNAPRKEAGERLLFPEVE
jgi:hypothetical protein